jgi:hypothetical protein|tara:strand:- start:18954 stop:19109 length:156 start_codon:yes stop_codon:yes gene_type:complete
MKLEELKQKVRQLGHLLATEEEAKVHLGKWYERKKLHDDLLEKLYKLEKRT